MSLDAPAIGYREFAWEGGPLLGAAVKVEWPVTREPQRAICHRHYDFQRDQGPSDHDAPQEDCTCGIYARSEPNMVYSGDVMAVVLGYGKIVVHPDGWRSEFAEIAGLLPSEDIGDRLSALEMLASAYGVPLVRDWDDALAIAQEFGGQPVPEILYAEAEAWGPQGGVQGGYFVPPLWITGEFVVASVKTLAGQNCVNVQLTPQTPLPEGKSTISISGYRCEE